MKKIQFIAALLFFFAIGNSAFAQTNPTVIAVVSKASWCPTCVKNEDRVMKEVLPNVDANKIQIVANDLSDKITKEVSAKQLTALGLNTKDYKSTGLITFVDAKTKKIITTVNVNESSEDILKAFENNSK
jgi:hypothetical protein